MKARYVLTGAALLASVAGTALAQTTPGFYVGLGGGVNFNRDGEVERGGVNIDKVDYDTGFAVVGAAGFKFDFGLRVEGEFGYRSNDVDKLRNNPPGSGDVDIFSAMANVIYDIPTGTMITPYVGLGVGVAVVDGDFKSGSATLASDTDATLAAQGIAGVTFSVTPQLGIFADYRYFVTEGPTFKTPGGNKVSVDINSHTLLIGLRYSFGAPPAPMPPPVAQPPAPTPMPMPPRAFLVFFDWDRADITPEAMRVLQQAADNYRKVGVTRVNLTGHADRSGSDKYNQALSIRRANAVKREMMRMGIPESQIATIGKGESQPLVPTPDGVREPQNRRVEIVF